MTNPWQDILDGARRAEQHMQAKAARKAAKAERDRTRRARDWVSGNWQDRHGHVSQGRGNGPPCKITIEDARAIRRRAADGEPHAQIARDYRLSRSYVSRITRNEVRKLEEA